MFSSQGHFEPVFENGPDIVFAILAAETEEASGLKLRAHEFLQRLIGRAKGDSSGAVLTADSRPKGVIAIEHNNLARWPEQGVELSDYAGGQRGEEQRCVRHVAQFLGGAIGIIGHGIPRSEFLRGQYINASQSLQLEGKRLCQIAEFFRQVRRRGDLLRGRTEAYQEGSRTARSRAG